MATTASFSICKSARLMYFPLFRFTTTENGAQSIILNDHQILMTMYSIPMPQFLFRNLVVLLPFARCCRFIFIVTCYILFFLFYFPIHSYLVFGIRRALSIYAVVLCCFAHRFVILYCDGMLSCVSQPITKFNKNHTHIKMYTPFSICSTR